MVSCLYPRGRFLVLVCFLPIVNTRFHIVMEAHYVGSWCFAVIRRRDGLINPVNRLCGYWYTGWRINVPKAFPKIFSKRKKKKRKSSLQWRFLKNRVFYKKYYPNRLMLWIAHFRLRVEIFSKTRRAWTCIFYKTGTYLYFLFLFFLRRLMLLFSTFRGSSCGIGNQTPPSTAENNDCSDSGNYYFSRSAVAGLRQSNSHPRPGTKRSPAFSAGRSGEKG